MVDFTTDQLIEYLYHETSEEETKAIEKTLQSDWNLKEQFEALKDTKHELDKLVTSPRKQSVMAILNYARTTTAIA